MELIRNSSENGMLRFTYYVKPEFEARKIKGGNYFKKKKKKI